MQGQMSVDAAVLDSAQAFASGYLQTHAPDWEQQRFMPREMFAVAAEYDLCGLLVPPEQGGRGINFATRIASASTYSSAPRALISITCPSLSTLKIKNIRWFPGSRSDNRRPSRSIKMVEKEQPEGDHKSQSTFFSSLPLGSLSE